MNLNNDYDEDGNNIVPCPICLSSHCPSKEEGICPEEEEYKDSLKSERIRLEVFWDKEGPLTHEYSDDVETHISEMLKKLGASRETMSYVVMTADSYKLAKKNETI